MWNAASRQFFLDQAKPYPYATGGDYVYLYEEDGKTYRVHEFLSTGTSTLNVEVGGQMDVLVVAGGGAGGRNLAGGGGGGGVILRSSEQITIGGEINKGPLRVTNNTNYTITVGSGGSSVGSNGSNSSFVGGTVSLIAIGGGGGGGQWDSTNYSGKNGGSGGGGWAFTSAGNGTSGQGNNGSTGENTEPWVGGGGGGAGAQPTNKKNGGNGITIWGKSYGGGGGGSSADTGAGGGTGGIGGGGAGTSSNAATGNNGTPNTGGGGGGVGVPAGGAFSSGGSGIVIVRYVVAEKKLWTPSELGSIKAWWDASDESTVTLSSSRVTQINDKSGNSLNLSNSGSTGPTLTTNGLNGLPTMTFTGSEWLSASSAADWKFLHDSTGSTVVAVWKAGTTSDPGAIYVLMDTGGFSSTTGYVNLYNDTSGANDQVKFQVSFGTPGQLVTNGETNNGSHSANAPHIVAFTSDPANGTASNRAKIRTDGGTEFSTNSNTNAASTSNPTNALHLGAAQSSQYYLDGYIAEVVICDSILSSTDRQKLEGYLAHKWGLTNNLPSGHPYKYEPPYKVEPEEIVTDGLVLNLDAGDYASYPRSGTTWYDISGSGNNGTLTNGPTYNSANKGSIVFDGSDDRALLPTNFFSYPSLTTFTISLWFRSSQTSGGTLFGQQNTNNPSSAGGWVPVVYLRSDGKIRAEPFWTGNSNNFILSSSTLNDDNWHNIVTTFNSGTNQLYVDGVYDTQQTGKTLTPYTSTYYYIIGAGYAASRSLGTNYFSGNIANFSFYNRALSATEVEQNFNALRGRYGI